jgi:hypothetical protein
LGQGLIARGPGTASADAAGGTAAAAGGHGDPGLADAGRGQGGMQIAGAVLVRGAVVIATRRSR